MFQPNLLDRAKFIDRTYGETTIREIESRIERFREDATCELLVCGFDADGDGQIIRIATGLGEICDSYATIGTGGPFADAHLAWRGTQSSDSLPRVLYEACEAELRAEQSAYVGPTHDVLVAYGLDAGGVRLLSVDTKELLAEAIRFHEATPFRDSSALREGESQRTRRDDWERELVEDKLGPVIAELDRRRRSKRT